MAEDIGTRDGSVNVGDDNFVIVIPFEEVALAPGCALVCGCHAELNLVDATLEVKTFLEGDTKLLIHI